MSTVCFAIESWCRRAHGTAVLCREPQDSSACTRSSTSRATPPHPIPQRTWTTNCVLLDTLYISDGVQNSDVVSLPRMHICAEHSAATPGVQSTHAARVNAHHRPAAQHRGTKTTPLRTEQHSNTSRVARGTPAHWHRGATHMRARDQPMRHFVRAPSSRIPVARSLHSPRHPRVDTGSSLWLPNISGDAHTTTGLHALGSRTHTTAPPGGVTSAQMMSPYVRYKFNQSIN